MAAIANVWLSVEKLEILLQTVKNKKDKGIGLDLFINDEPNKYGQNVSVSVSQTKEQRTAKVDKYYVGNGKVTWVKGEVKVAPKSADDLPF